MTKLGIVPITIDRGLFVDVKALHNVLKNTIEATAKSVQVDFKVTAQTWENKPKFSISRTGSNQFQSIRYVGTDNLIYKFINGGTKVRYAVMTPDFQAKTKVRVIGSGAGKGGFSRFNMKKPKPGIKARNFDDEIAKKWQRLLPQIVTRAIAAEVG